MAAVAVEDRRVVRVLVATIDAQVDGRAIERLGLIQLLIRGAAVVGSDAIVRVGRHADADGLAQGHFRR